MSKIPSYIIRLRKARTLATELRCLLEELKDEAPDFKDIDNDLDVPAEDIEDFADKAGNIESWLDDLNLGDQQ